MNTRKDYIRAAAIVVDMAADMKDPANAIVACRAFMHFFRGDNPRFDAGRFADACGFPGLC